MKKPTDITSLRHQLFMVRQEITTQEIALTATQGKSDVIRERIADLHHIASGFEAELIDLEAQS